MARIKVKIPKLGLTVTSGRVVEWSRQIGDRVEAGAVIGMLEVDKASYEITAPAAGVIAAFLVPADPDSELDIGTEIAVINGD
jgi:pyruvate/2-oxoglutarate dehydrogenase complex dihydrolipoamide acyltransferase (E2) component